MNSKAALANKLAEKAGLTDAKSNTIPSCKSINKPAGLFIGEDNLKSSGWKPELMAVGKPHKLVTRKLDPITKGFEEKGGILLEAPRLLILRSSPLLCKNLNTGYVDCLWNAPLHKPVPHLKSMKRHLVLFVDEKNEPMHTRPIQLSAMGHFLYNFEKMYEKFVVTMMAQENLPFGGKLDDTTDNKQLYFASLFVYAPVFQSQAVGTPPNSSMACITTDFKPSVMIEANDEHMELFQAGKNWWKKAVKNLSQSLEPSPTPSVVDSNFGGGENIVYEEEVDF